MIKIVTIIGARPQIIKAAALSRIINKKFRSKIQEIIIHTGQHYDDNMSQVFFDELGIPKPNFNLDVRLATHGEQTGAMVKGIEEIIIREKPSCVIIYGDTNSTLAGAIAASKIHVPIAHIEAGLRSYNKLMPEELNRVISDHVSTFLFCPTQTSFDNLLNEGFKQNNQPPFNINNPKLYHSGDVMYDNSLHFAELSERKSSILEENELQSNQFILATVHRNNNTDDVSRLKSIFTALIKIAEKQKVIIPLHPRTNKQLEQLPELLGKIRLNSNIILSKPVSFLEMICLEKNAALIITDSGGVQKEAFFFKKPCVILRSETEWVELVDCGASRLADADEELIINAVDYFSKLKDLNFPQLFGTGSSAEFICTEILANL
ncbi:MAG TPA: UDP-N-acetylglucosamine 2-epimerase (non-hydrolyzing) [Chitinophagales bacterium]|nr:UDP-N-acetylglucosamine 2-epimerase (non-hydrolyzing) [Chitinophagales bacterium]